MTAIVMASAICEETSKQIQQAANYLSPNTPATLGFADKNQQKLVERLAGDINIQTAPIIGEVGLRQYLAELKEHGVPYNTVSLVTGSREDLLTAKKLHLRTVLVEKVKKFVIGDAANLTAEKIRELKPRTKAVAFDADNTLFGYHATELPPEILEMLTGLKRVGLKLYIASNCYDERERELTELARTKYLDDEGQPLFEEVVTPATVTPPGEEVSNYKKPHEYMPQYIAESNDYDFDEVLFVGDQLRSDGKATEALDMPFVHVDKRGKGDHPIVRLHRPIEKIQRALRGSSFFPEKLTPLDKWQTTNFISRAIKNYKNKSSRG